MVQDMIGTTTNDSYNHHQNINGDSAVEIDENHFVAPPCCYDIDDQDDGEDGQDDDDHDDHDTTDMKPLQNEEKGTISMNPSLVQPKIPVDRQWLQKLLRKYWFTCQYQQQQLPLSSTTGNAPPPPPMLLPLPPESMKCHAYICAPMVDQSDLPFRMLCRQYGCNLAYTPMIHAKLFQTNPKYHQVFLPKSVPLGAATTTTTIPVLFTTINNNIDTGSSRLDITEMDRPLIAQICGSSIQYVIPTALQLAPYVDAIDINCGCPQNIAKRGNYGAFLLEQETYLLQLVQTLTSVLTIPVTVKVRLLPPLSKSSSSASCDDTTNHDIPQKQQRDESVRRSMILYEKLVHLGHVHMICLHGRTRHHKGVRTGPADWDAIREVVQTFGTTIPVIANGSLANQNEIRQCLEYTKADGVMSSEALLEYPPLFHNLIRQDYYHHQHCRDDGNVGDDDDDDDHSDTPNVNPVAVNGITLAQQYYDLATRFPPNVHGQGSNAIKVIKIHIHRFCHYYLQSDIQIRKLLIDATTTEALWNVIVLLQQQYESRTLSSTAAAATTTDQYCHDPSALSWYYRHSRTVRHGNNEDDDNDDDEGPRLLLAQMEHERTVTSQIDLVMDDDAADCFNSLFQINDDE